MPKRGKPYWVKIAKGLSLGYRRNETAGPWIVRSIAGGKHWIRNFATADDFEDANGDTILDFFDAQRIARNVARNGGKDDAAASLITVAQAIERYRDELKARGKDQYNADLAKIHLPPSIRQKPVATLSPKELGDYRNGLLATHSRGAINRIICPLSAALNLAASKDASITNASAWKIGLQKLPDASRSNNVVISDDDVRRVIEAAYEDSLEFGRLIEAAALTGARYSQLARIEVRDLQVDRLRVMIPTSSKGRGVKKTHRKPVPIPAATAVKLQQAAEGRKPGDLLFVKSDGGKWGAKHQTRLFARVAAKLGLLDHDDHPVTMYCLRHSSITRHLLANTPIRIVADLHDTSVVMIEKTYSAYIAEHSDALFRRALLDVASPKIVPLAA